MERKGDIWVVASSYEAGRHIRKIFEEAKLHNSITVIAEPEVLAEQLEAGQMLEAVPQILLVELTSMDGFALRTMRAAEKHPALKGVPVIALLDESNDNDIDASYEAGAKTYLLKPFKFAQFVERCRMLNLHFTIVRRESGAGSSAS